MVNKVIVIVGLIDFGLFMFDSMVIKLMSVFIIFIVGVILFIFLKMVVLNLCWFVVMLMFFVSVFCMILMLCLFISILMFFCIKGLLILVFLSVRKFFFFVVLVILIIFLINFFGELILNMNVLLVILFVLKNCFMVYWDKIMNNVLLKIIKIEGILMNIFMLLFIIMVIIMKFMVFNIFMMVVKFIYFFLFVVFIVDV